MLILLSVGGKDVTDDALTNIIEGCFLISPLELESVAISDRGFSELSKLKNLVHLKVTANWRISSTGFKSVLHKGFKSLVLDFCASVGDEYVISIVTECPYLEVLSLRGSSISNQATQVLQQSNLKELDISYCARLTETCFARREGISVSIR